MPTSDPFAAWHESGGSRPLGGPLAAASSLFEWCGRIILLAVLVCAPWAFGGAEHDDQRWIYAGVLTALGLWLLAICVQPREKRITPPIVPTLLAPIVGALLLGAVQIAPGLQSKLTPANSAGRDGAAEANATAPGRLSPLVRTDLSRRSQISLYPASTRLELARLTIGAAALLAGLGLFAVPRVQRLLWLVLALNGAALTVFGIVQKSSWNGKIYWSVPLTLGGQPFASFVNRNNAAGYLNLCLGAAFGFAVWAFWKSATAYPSDFGRMSRSRRELNHPWVSRLMRLESQHFLAILLCILILAGVCGSLSRGGTVSAVIALLSMVVLLGFQRGAKVAAWTAGGGLGLCAALLTGLGLSSGLAARLSTLFDERVTMDTRWINWQSAWRAVEDYPLLGTGLGTYRYAYMPYQTQNVHLWFYNADNHYVEGLTEGGAVGLILIAACVLLMLQAVWILARGSIGCSSIAVLYVGLFAVVSQCLQAGTDFGISVPSNLVTFATICGVVVGEAARCCIPHRPPLSLALPVWQPRWVITVVSLGLLLNGVVGVAEVSKAAVAKSARTSLPPLPKPDSLSEPRLDAVIESLNAAVRRRPDDAELRLSLADLWIYRFRQQSYRLLEERAAQSPAMREPDWNSIGLVSLHQLANAAWRESGRQALDDLRQASLVQENLRPARGHWQAARAACPVIPGVSLNLAMTDFLDNADPSGMVDVERATALAPVNDDTLFTAGVLAKQASRPELCELYWARCLSMIEQHPTSQGVWHQTEILNAAVDRVPFSELVERVLPASAPLLLELARTRFSGATRESERRLLAQKSQQILEQGAARLSDAEQCYWFAVADRLLGRPARAIELYRQALELQPERLEWRIELAQAFQEAGRLEDAIQEARWCVEMSPNTNSVAESLLKDLLQEKKTKAAMPPALPPGK